MSTPTQVRYPWRATVRTVFVVALAVLTALGISIPVFTESLGGYLPAAWVKGLLWFAGLTTALALALQRIIVLAPVADLLARVGLGAQPRELD